jgi:4-amino-4-deoxy-L-arabinose transferase-like glycosyltransferase
MSRMLTMDGLLSLFVLAAWLSGHRALTSPSSSGRYGVLAAIACGLGILTKGPVALILAASPLAAYRMLDRRSAPVGYRRAAVFAFVVLAVAAPWYIAAAWRAPGFLGDFLYQHNFLRYVTPFDHEEPFWYYGPLLFVGMMPWTLLWLPLLRGIVGTPAMARRKRPAAMGLFILAFAFSFIFYSLAGCKRPGYILPAMPPLALALGCYLRVRLPRRVGYLPQVLRQLSRLPHALTVAVLASGAVAFAGACFAGLVTVQHAIPLAGIFFVAALYLFARRSQAKPGAAWAGCAVATFLLLLVSIHEIWPGYAHKFSVRAQVRPQKCFSNDPAFPVVCYPHRWDSVGFYLGRRDVATYSSAERDLLVRDLGRRPQTLVFVKSDHYCTDLIKSLPPKLQFEAYGKNGLVTAGVVRRSSTLPEGLYAGR